MINWPRLWFTALCCRSSLSTHWNFFLPSPVFTHTHNLKLSPGCKSPLSCIWSHVYLNLDILIKSHTYFNILTANKYSCLQQSDMQKIKVAFLRLRNSKSQAAFRVCCITPKRRTMQTSFHMLNLCHNYTGIWQWLRERVCVLSDIMHCGGWLILLHSAIYFSGKEGFHKASARQRQWEESLEEILETDTLKCRVSHREKKTKRDHLDCDGISRDIICPCVSNFNGMFKGQTQPQFDIKTREATKSKHSWLPVRRCRGRCS